MDKDINLDAPALPDADEAEDTETSTEGSQPEQEVEEEQEGDDSEDTSASQQADDERRVPYSRFHSVNSEKQEALERAIRAETELELLRKQNLPESRTLSDETPPHEWVELYGDSELSRKAWTTQQSLDKRRFAEMQSEAAKAAIDGLRKAETETKQRESEAAEQIVDALEDYQSSNKRRLNDAEQSAVLDIMDELSPKDAEGNYIVHPTQFLDRAVELYDLRKQKATEKTRTAKRSATQMAGTSSEGETTGETSTTHFKPGNWGSWRDNPLLPKV